MKYRMFESGSRYLVSVFDGVVWMTFVFLDVESQRNFVVALGNCAEDYEEMT